MATLNSDIVLKIKQAIWKGETQAQTARRFGTSQPTISRIVQGETWPDVPWPDGSVGPLSNEKKAELIEGEINERVTQRLKDVYSILSEEQKSELFPPDIIIILDELLGEQQRRAG